jgi:hypothetical protein
MSYRFLADRPFFSSRTIHYPTPVLVQAQLPGTRANIDRGTHVAQKDDARQAVKPRFTYASCARQVRPAQRCVQPIQEQSRLVKRYGPTGAARVPDGHVSGVAFAAVTPVPQLTAGATHLKVRGRIAESDIGFYTHDYPLVSGRVVQGAGVVRPAGNSTKTTRRCPY